jgi:RNA polymerase sigma factor (sigma-70 family)
MRGKEKEAGVTQSTKRIIDNYLVASARLGDRGALEQLVNRYQRRFLGHAYRMLGDVEQARDAVQDGWIEILRGFHNLQDEGAFSAWAFRIITRKCGKHIAGLRRNRAILQDMSDEALPDPPTENGIEKADGRKPLREALAKLPAPHRAAIGLFYLEEMSVAEVAVALETPVGTVKTRLMNARRKLRAELEGEYHGQSR